MKKYLLVITLVAFSLFFIGCDKKTQNQPENNPTPSMEQTEQNTEETEVIDQTEENTEVELNEGEETNEPEQTFVPGDYVTDTHEDMTFDEIGAALTNCDEMGENPVCGKDGGTYFNKCYLDFAGIEEETELAQVVDGICQFS